MKQIYLLAVAILGTVMVSCSGSEVKKEAEQSQTSTTTESNSIQYNGKIAFIRMDSLMNNYGMYIDLSDEFAKKSQSVQTELMNKGRSLEAEGRKLDEDYQKGSLTRFQVESKAQELQKKQQDVVAYRDRKLAELQQQEAEMSQKISSVVKEFLEQYNAEKKYSLILQTMGGSPVLIADPSLDITNEILTELNKRYQDSLAKK